MQFRGCICKPPYLASVPKNIGHETAYLKTFGFPTFLFKCEPSFGGCKIGNAWLHMQPATSVYMCGLQICDMFSGLRVKILNSNRSERDSPKASTKLIRSSFPNIFAWSSFCRLLMVLDILEGQRRRGGQYVIWGKTQKKQLANKGPNCHKR